MATLAEFDGGASTRAESENERAEAKQPAEERQRPTEEKRMKELEETHFLESPDSWRQTHKRLKRSDQTGGPELEKLRTLQNMVAARAGVPVEELRRNVWTELDSDAYDQSDAPISDPDSSIFTPTDQAHCRDSLLHNSRKLAEWGPWMQPLFQTVISNALVDLSALRDADNRSASAWSVNLRLEQILGNIRYQEHFVRWLAALVRNIKASKVTTWIRRERFETAPQDVLLARLFFERVPVT